MSRSNRIYIIYIVLLTVFISCAKVSSPSGGPQDEQPPQVILSEPENFTVNFDKRSFAITFDEYFVLDNADQVLMISPPLREKPEVRTRGKTMIVELDEDEELQDNLTYSFNFLNSIKDLNEGNPLENYKYVFSTGEVIDSLSVTGTVYNAVNLEAEEDVFILMHSEKADTMPLTTLPVYITRAMDNGDFRIDNIAEGEYMIYALKDENSNKVYDLQTEAFAFLDSSVYISPADNYIPVRPDSLMTADTLMTSDTLMTADSLMIADSLMTADTLMTADSLLTKQDSLFYERTPGSEYNLFLFVADNKTQYLTGAERSRQYLLQFTFAMPVDSGSFRTRFIEPDTIVNYIQEVSAERDTFKLWLTDSTVYKRELLSIEVNHPKTDSLGDLVMVKDTVNLRFVNESRGRQPEKTKNILAYNTNISGSATISPDSKPVFVFETPMNDPDTSLIDLYVKSDTLKINKDYSIIRDSLNSKRFIIESGFHQDSSYVLLLDRGAFSNIYRQENDSLAYNFNIGNQADYGKLVLNLSGYEGNVIVHLLDSKENPVRTEKISLPRENTVTFNYISSRDYLVKIVFDINGDGKWTTGDYELKRQAEPVSYYPKLIEVKKGWELIEDWEISGMNKKAESISSTRGEEAGK
ncbi:MAG: Ig-like domain-containing protein [Bacteroidales bacterium]|nr:Ig-like domain-containing protein [Bacteroidales bacterium]